MLIHWVADFIMQDDDIANKKHSGGAELLFHSLLYSTVCTLFMAMLLSFVSIGADGIQPPIVFLILAVSHYVIDFVTSNITGWAYINNRHRLFFNTIGFDQFLHLTLLFCVFNELSK